MNFNPYRMADILKESGLIPDVYQNDTHVLLTVVESLSERYPQLNSQTKLMPVPYYQYKIAFPVKETNHMEPVHRVPAKGVDQFFLRIFTGGKRGYTYEAARAFQGYRTIELERLYITVPYSPTMVDHFGMTLGYDPITDTLFYHAVYKDKWEESDSKETTEDTKPIEADHFEIYKPTSENEEQWVTDADDRDELWQEAKQLPVHELYKVYAMPTAELGIQGKFVATIYAGKLSWKYDGYHLEESLDE